MSTVLILPSLYFETTLEHDELDRALEDISNDIHAALKALCQRQPLRFEGNIAYRYLDEEENAARCSRCGHWTTDRDRPCPLEGLPEGVQVEGRLICDQCRFADEQ